MGWTFCFMASLLKSRFASVINMKHHVQESPLFATNIGESDVKNECNKILIPSTVLSPDDHHQYS